MSRDAQFARAAFERRTTTDTKDLLAGAEAGDVANSLVDLQADAEGRVLDEWDREYVVDLVTRMLVREMYAVRTLGYGV